MLNNCSCRFNKVLTRFIWLSSLFFAIVLFLILFTAKNSDYCCKVTVTSSKELLFLLVGVALYFLLWQLLSFLRKVDLIRLNSNFLTILFLIISTIALIYIQFTILNRAFFKTGWDVWEIALNDNHDGVSSYLSVYPNQLFLYCVLQSIASISKFFGLMDVYRTEAAVGAMCITTSVVLVTASLRFLFGNRVAILSHISLLLLVGLSPWMLVPYSDSYGIICPSIVLYLYCRFPSNAFSKTAIGFFGYIGYLIKPTAIFVLAAILFIDILRLHFDRYDCAFHFGINRSLSKIFRYEGVAFTVFGVIIAIVISGLFTSGERAQLNLDSNRSFSMSHFLMMGINPETRGVYSQDDANISLSCQTKEERWDENLKIWKARVSELGITGLLHLYHLKLLTAFSDGTFAWAQEGAFWYETNEFDSLSDSFYGIGNFSGLNPDKNEGLFFILLEQPFWLAMLLGIVLLPFNESHKKEIAVAQISVLCLGLFLMIFETRARYLFLYAPYFVFLGVVGWAGFLNYFDRCFVRIKNRQLTY